MSKATSPSQSRSHPRTRSTASAVVSAHLSRFSPEQRSEMETRGSLEVKVKAVERIAQVAVLEVDGVAPTESTSGALSTALGRAHPRVDVEVAGRRARVQVEMAILWPSPAAAVAARVREHVGRRLHQLGGLDVDAVTVTVTKVVPRGTTEDRRRVQ